MDNTSRSRAMFRRICSYHNALLNAGKTITRKIQVNQMIPQLRAYAAKKPATKGQKGPALAEDQQDSYMEKDASKLCKNVCINYHNDVESPGPEIKADSEYPDWLFKLDLEPGKQLEDLDPEKDGWKYWEKWEQRRQAQIHLHNKLKYKYIWMQNSPSIDLMLRYNKYKNADKGHIYHIIPNTCGGIYMKAQKHRRLNDTPYKRWATMEEPEHLLEENGY